MVVEYKVAKSIKYLEFFNDQSENPTTIVFFHGYGADAKDLVFLKDYIKSDLKLNWIFPEGSFDASFEGVLQGKSWFPLDIKALNLMSAQKDYEGISRFQSPLLEETAFKIEAFLENVIKKKGNLILGGFSQGSVLAFNLAFYKKEKPKALILFSSNLINKENLLKQSSGCSGVPFFQSHGKQDAVLSYEMGQRLNTFLHESGLKGEFVFFNGGHEIPLEVLEKTGEFLNKIKLNEK